jgi:hypothetical protein
MDSYIESKRFKEEALYSIVDKEEEMKRSFLEHASLKRMLQLFFFCLALHFSEMAGKQYKRHNKANTNFTALTWRPENRWTKIWRARRWKDQAINKPSLPPHW